VGGWQVFPLSFVSSANFHPHRFFHKTDASRFGQSYLEKFGWDPSKGLGSSGEGRTSAIKASQKLDMLGIGMQHQKDPNGIAWRQNRDFENLLRRLNGGTDGATSPFHRAREEEEEEESPKGGTGTLQKMNEGDGNDNDDDEEHEDVVTRKDKKKKKRKTAEELEGDRPPDKKERKKRKKMRDGDARAVPNNESEPPPLPPPCCPPEVPAQEPGYASMPGVTAPVPVPVSIRAPYVARSFYGS